MIWISDYYNITILLLYYYTMREVLRLVCILMLKSQVMV